MTGICGADDLVVAAASELPQMHRTAANLRVVLLQIKRLARPKWVVSYPFRSLIITLVMAGAALAQMSVSGSMPVTILDTAPAAQSIAALNGVAAVALSGQAGAAVTLSGTWTATLSPELSFDGGTTWAATYFYQPGVGR
jgi:hypothetical protein